MEISSQHEAEDVIIHHAEWRSASWTLSQLPSSSLPVVHPGCTNMTLFRVAGVSTSAVRKLHTADDTPPAVAKLEPAHQRINAGGSQNNQDKHSQLSVGGELVVSSLDAHGDQKHMTQEALHPAVMALLLMERRLLIDGERSKLIVNPSATVRDYEHVTNVDLQTFWSLGQTSSTCSQRWGVHQVIGLWGINKYKSHVEYVLEYDPVQKHDFSQGACQVNCLLRFRNVTQQPLNVLLELLHPSARYNFSTRQFDQSASDVNMYGRYFWTGCTLRRVNNLQPQEVVELPLTAAFYLPGEYNLNRFQFYVESIGEAKNHLRQVHTQHRISIADSSFMM
jgi:hypothetical protein